MLLLSQIFLLLKSFQKEGKMLLIWFDVKKRLSDLATFSKVTQKKFPSSKLSSMDLGEKFSYILMYHCNL